MNEPDARYLKLEIQTYLRLQAIKLQQGKTFVSIGEYLGVHRNTVAVWWKNYQHRGEAALKQDVRGHQVGEGRSLNKQEETFIQRILQAQFPEEVSIDSALWTRRTVVQELVVSECGDLMPIRTVGEYLSRWGYTAQKPLKRAYEQDSEAVEDWLNNQYPATFATSEVRGSRDLVGG